MAWSIRWTDEAIRDINHPEISIARRTVRELGLAAGNPIHFYHRFVGRTNTS